MTAANDDDPGGWLEAALRAELAARNVPRGAFQAPRLHYSRDLDPDSCRRRTYYALRYPEEPLDVSANLTSRMGDAAEAIAIAAVKRSGRLIAEQVRVNPLRPSAWCWAGTADLLFKEGEDLVVGEIKSVEPAIADLIAKTGRLDLAKRERHVWQLSAYKSGLEEKLGPIKHRLIFVPRGDGPVVQLSPPLPPVSEIIARELEGAKLVPVPGQPLDFTALPARLPLTQRPRAKDFRMSPTCRWCAFQARCGIAQVVSDANSGIPVRARSEEAPEPDEALLEAYDEPPATAQFGTWDLDPPPTHQAAGGGDLPGSRPSQAAPLPAPPAAVSTQVAKRPYLDVVYSCQHDWNHDQCQKCGVCRPPQKERESVKDDDSDQGLIDALNEIGSGLTPWEQEFIQSVDDQVGAGRTLSEKQRGICSRILEEKS